MLGTTYFKAGRLEHAVVALRDALKVDADHASSYTALGEALAGLGRIEEAAQNFRYALDREDFRADAHAKYADILYTLGRTEEAQEHYRSALREPGANARPPDPFCSSGVVTGLSVNSTRSGTPLVARIQPGISSRVRL